MWRRFVHQLGLWRRLAVAWVWLASACASAEATQPRALPLLRIEFFSVGQGDAALITSPIGKTVLIDGGPDPTAGPIVKALTAQRQGPVDLILLTHRHADHLNGLASVV